MKSTELLCQQRFIESKLDGYNAIISKARKGAMGLTLEEDKTHQWKQARQQHAVYFAELRKVNQQLNKLRKCTGFEIINGKRIAIYKYKDVA